MLDTYPPGGSANTSAYFDALANALTLHPRHVAVACANVNSGVITEIMFKPTVGDIHTWCNRNSKWLRDLDDKFERESKLRNETAKYKTDAQIDYERRNRESLDELRARHGKFWGLKGIDRTDVARFGTGGASEFTSRRDAAEAVRKAKAAEIDAARYERWTLAEYERLGIDPVRSASGVLLHPDLLTTLGRLPVQRKPQKATRARVKAKAVA